MKPDFMKKSLAERFKDNCTKFNLPDNLIARVWNNLQLHYSENHRHYHTLAHIEKMIDFLETTKSDTSRLELAIWFHDYIYDPHSHENEKQSAEAFIDLLGRHVSDEVTNDVVRLIMATDHRTPRSGRADEQLIIDLDLSIFASLSEEYDEYRRAIRLEYDFVPESEYRKERTAILSHFLSQPIFTGSTLKLSEAKARENITRELALLK
jgi:predicted metal-dependent HD superfamily phosphohydrolase